jgi:integrase/vacuolar-type H+-ATPase subunit H
MADLADKIKNKSLTVGEALDIRKVPASLRKNIEAAGLTMDSPWDSIKDTDFLTKLNEVGSESNFTSLNTIENELKAAASAADTPFPYTTVFGAEGKARKGLGLEKAKQARRTKAFKGVPEAKQSLKALTEGIAAIPDPQTRAAVAFNALVPLRPGEVAGIKIDDIDFETGSFKEAYRRVNKIRNELDLPEVALEILRDAADTARAEGREYLFLPKDVENPKQATSTFVKKMTAAVKAPGGIGPRFKPFAKEMGRDVVGASDIRKIIPSIIANELGYKSEASAIMGHASFDETVDGMKAITRKHYASQIITGEGTTAKQALRALQNMYGEVLGLSTLNELPASMGVEAKGLTIEGAPKLAVIPKGAEIVGTQVQGTLTDADLDLIEDVREARSQELKLAATTAEKQRLELETQMGELDEEAIRSREQRRLKAEQIRKEERAKIKAGLNIESTSASTDLSDYLDQNPEVKNQLEKTGLLSRFLGKTTKAIGIGAALETARQFIEEPVATAAELGKEVLLERGLGAGPGAAVSMIMQPTELASGELTPEDRAMAEVQRDTGFIDIDRGPEAAPVNQDQGFLSR